jgi:hypothetical protein
MFPEYRRMFPEYRRMFPEYGQMFPEYRPIFPKYCRMFLGYRRLFPEHRRMFPEHRRMFPKYRRMFPEYQGAGASSCPLVVWKVRCFDFFIGHMFVIAGSKDFVEDNKRLRFQARKNNFDKRFSLSKLQFPQIATTDATIVAAPPLLEVMNQCSPN